MPKKGSSEAKKLIKSWLEEFCQRNATFKRNLFILYKQKKYKDISSAIKKEYLNGKSSDEATNFLQNSEHVIDIMKHLENYDFSSQSKAKKDNKSLDKRSISDVESSATTIESNSSKKVKKTKENDKVQEKEKEEEEDFNEDEMTSFLDQADDDAMKRFYAVRIFALPNINISWFVIVACATGGRWRGRSGGRWRRALC